MIEGEPKVAARPVSPGKRGCCHEPHALGRVQHRESPPHVAQAPPPAGSGGGDRRTVEAVALGHGAMGSRGLCRGPRRPSPTTSCSPPTPGGWRSRRRFAARRRRSCSSRTPTRRSVLPRLVGAAPCLWRSL
jgi:hypothetical protein